MESIIEVLSVIPVPIGLLMGVIGIIPVIPMLFGKPPKNGKVLALSCVIYIIGAIGMVSAMSQIISAEPNSSMTIIFGE